MLRCITVSLFCLTAFASRCQTPPSTTPTLKAGVQLVVEDVVVTDTHGNPVHGLKQGDFIVQENKAAQTIRGFEEHTGSQRQGERQPLPPGVFSNIPVVAGSINVLLLDGLNTPAQAQPFLRDQLVRFLAAERPGTRTAIFTLNQSLHLLQDFTTDPALLKRVVKLQGVQFSPLLNRELNDTAAHQTSETLSGMIEAASDPSHAAVLEAMQQSLLDMEARRASVQTQVRARTTMDALSQMARYLAGVPGRKNLLWFSGSFPISIMRDIQTTGDPFAGQADLSYELKRTVDLLAQNQVAVYPIDARGLEAPPSQGSDESGYNGNLQRTQRTYGTLSATPRDSQFYTDQANEHSTMRELAEGTGGEAFYNTNGLFEAIQHAANDGENYYTVQYTPPPGSKPGAFRKIEVKIDRPGLKLAYRRGYYADATGTAAAGSPTAGASSLAISAAYSVPDSSEIALLVQPIKIASAPPDRTIGLQAAGPAQHQLYALNLQVPVDALNLAPSDDGKIHLTLEFATLLYDPKGKVIDSHQDRAALVLDAERYRAMALAGIRFHHNIALPADSKGSVRVLVHDVTSSRVGSLRLSDAQVRHAANAAPAP